MFKRIVVGLDGSEHARKALDVATDLAKSHGASLVLVRALSTGPLTEAERRLARAEYGVEDLDERAPMTVITEAGADPRMVLPITHERPVDAALRARIEIARDLLEDARRDTLRRGVESVEIRIETGDPAKVILDVAKAEKADLIVIGSRGLSDLQGLVFGSTSHKVTHLASCSCLTVS
jgi:nucleotide-binding universal stress UspA family protein